MVLHEKKCTQYLSDVDITPNQQLHTHYGPVRVKQDNCILALANANTSLGQRSSTLLIGAWQSHCSMQHSWVNMRIGNVPFSHLCSTPLYRSLTHGQKKSHLGFVRSWKSASYNQLPCLSMNTTMVRLGTNHELLPQDSKNWTAVSANLRFQCAWKMCLFLVNSNERNIFLLSHCSNNLCEVLPSREESWTVAAAL